jgi:Tfp pilus assembly protein PilN
VIRINLLPPEYRAAQARREQRVVFGSAGGLIVIVMLLFWMLKARQAAALQTKISEAEAELRKYEAIVAQIEAIESEKKQMVSKRDVIRNLNRSRLLYPVFFEDFLPVVPSDVWVTSIQITDSPNGSMRVSMNCNGLSNFAVATWLSNLQQSPNFSAIDLGAISYSNAESGGQTLNYSLQFSYQHKGPFPLQDLN